MKKLSQGFHLSITLILTIVLLAAPAIAKGKATGSNVKRTAPSSSKSHLSGRTAKVSQRSDKVGRNERRRLAARRSRLNRVAMVRLRNADVALKKSAQELISEDDLRFEDQEVRRAALDALGGHAGAVVVMDPRSGRVLSIVNQEWAARKGFKPCSTIKPVVALAGLEEGLIDPAEAVSLGRRTLPITLSEALAHSNNPYFQRVGMKLGLSKLLGYARAYGFGQRTGINLADECAGRIPSARTVSTRAVGHMSSHGDGFEVTALQLAVFTSALVNGGYVYKPQVVSIPTGQAMWSAKDHAASALPAVIAAPSNSLFKPVLVRKIEIPKEHRDQVISGMIGAVEFGTAKLAYYPSLSIAGKTGTCTGNHLRLGLFTSFATVDNPNVVVVVITNGMGEKGPLAAQVAGAIYQRISNRLAEPAAVGALGGH